MSTGTLIVLVVVLVVVIAIAVWFTTRQQRRRAELRNQFGPEYDRAVAEYGGSHKAEAELSARAERVEQLHIRPLPAEQSARYADSWRAVQAQFVDDPENAIREADRQVADVMQARGYPMGDFEQRAADISVDHPSVVDNYRAAHAIAGRTERGDASTEDMRQAMVHYRSLFEELIEPSHVEAR